MFGLRSARSRAIAAGALGLLLLVSVAAVAVWRAHDDQQRHERLEHRSAVVAALENARAQTFAAATWVATAAFADDPAPLHELYRQAILASRQGVDESRAELIAIDGKDELAAVEDLGSQMDELTQELDTLWAFALTADRDARVEMAQRDMGRLWPLAMGVIGSLEQLATEHQSALAAERAAADRASDTTLWLLIGLGAAAFVVVTATVAGLIVWTTRPLAALRASARAITAGDSQARANVSGPEEVASLARDFNTMTNALSAKTQEFIDTTNLTGDVIVKVNRDGRVTFVNDAACEFFRKPREELVSAHYTDYVQPDDLASTAQLIRQATARRELVRGFVNHMITPMGTRVVEWNGYPLFDEEGRYAGLQATGRDITERKRAEEALRESEEKYRRLVRDSLDGIVIAQGVEIKFVNPALLKMFGYQREEEMVGHPFTDFVSAEYRNPLVERGYAREKGQEVPDRYEHKALRKDGSEFYVEVSVSRVTYQGRAARQVIFRDVSERKRAEEALRQSEERLRRFTSSATDGFMLYDSELNLVEINDSALKVLSLRRENVIGKHLLEISPDAKETGRYDRYMEVMRTGEPFLVDDLVLHPKFGEKCVFLKAFRVGDGLGLIGTDITERKRAEETLRESEEKYRLLAENATDVIWTMDTNLRVTYMSPSVTRLRGYTVQEVMGQTLKEMLTPASLEIVKKAIADEQAMEASEGKDLTRSRTVEVEQTCKDGSTVWVEAKFTILRDPGGQAIGTLGITRDISERKRAEEALRESEEKFRNIFQSANDGLIYLDTAGLVLDINDKAVELFGGPREELLGKHFTTVGVFRPTDVEPLMTNFASLLRGERASVEIRIKNKKGQERFLDCTGSSLKIDGKTPGVVVVAVRDVTERKRAEKALRKAREDIESRVERRVQEVNGYCLTFRELTILHLVAAGKADKEIATVLGISPGTAHKHLANILGKMGAASRTEAGVRALREGLLD